MATDIIRSLSGIRGLVAGPLTAAEAYRTVRAYYAVYLRRFIQSRGKNLVVIGKDPKASGDRLVPGALAALRDISREEKVRLTPWYLGVTTSPLLAWAVTKLDAIGGINFTASHNPIEWNGIKLIARPAEQATLLHAGWMAKINAYLTADDRRLTVDRQQAIKDSCAAAVMPKTRGALIHDYNRDVVRQVGAVIDACSGRTGLARKLLQALRARDFSVVVDGCCAEGGNIVAGFLAELGLARSRISVINTGTIEESDRRLEPAPPFLDNLCATLAERRADIGFAVDPDQDRLVALPLASEEHTPLLAARFLFELQKDSRRKYIRHACVNLSTTGAWEEVAEALGVKIVRTPIGEVNVARAMVKKRTILGAEGNGGVLLAPVNYGRNSTVAILLLLLYMTCRNQGIRELEAELPLYLLVKDKMDVPDPAAAVHKVTEHYRRMKKTVRVDTQDGCKVLFADRSWVQVRASNTEPIIRIFAEVRAADPAAASGRAQRLIDDVKKLV